MTQGIHQLPASRETRSAPRVAPRRRRLRGADAAGAAALAGVRRV